MEKRFVYADNAATTPMSETAFNAMKPWLTENYGNPSSLYRIGRAAKEALNDARTVVGKCLNAAEPVNEKNDYAPGEIVFTGGGSEGNDTIFRMVRWYWDLLEQPQESDRETHAKPDFTANAAVEFKHVGFEYVKGKPVLTDINLTVDAGQTVALVGGSGCGKYAKHRAA